MKLQRIVWGAVVAVLAMLVQSIASAHGGKADSYGCHNNRKLGGYHCHKGPLAGRSFSSQAEMLAALGKAQPEEAPQAPEKRLTSMPSKKGSKSDGGADAIAKIEAAKGDYENRQVALDCTAKSLKQKVSKNGNSYFTFACDDGTGTMTVFSFGKPRFEEGQKVNVKGIYNQAKTVGRYTFYNQVDASAIEIKGN